LLVGFVDVDAAILALADGGVDISSEREHVSTTPASLSWPPKDQHKDILEDLRKADKRRILIVDARSWDAVQWKAADVTVVLFAETGRIELYILTDSMDQLPFLIRPSFSRVICSQRASRKKGCKANPEPIDKKWRSRNNRCKHCSVPVLSLTISLWP
jgi:hypothetical protein